MDASDGEAIFIREFTLSRRDDLPDDFLNEGHASHKSEDSVSVRMCIIVFYMLLCFFANRNSHSHYFINKVSLLISATLIASDSCYHIVSKVFYYYHLAYHKNLNDSKQGSIQLVVTTVALAWI